MQVGRIGVRICVIIAHLWVINVVCVLHNSAFLPIFAAVTGYLYPISTLDTLSNQEKVKIMHKKFLLACGLAFAAISAFAQQQWTISVQNQGTAGGYILDKNGKSVGNYSYSQFYPSKGYTPCWVVRFPKGNYTITSGNTGKIDVRNMNTGEDVTTGQSARSFSFRAPETAWYRLLLRDGVTNTEMSAFTSIYRRDGREWRCTWPIGAAFRRSTSMVLKAPIPICPAEMPSTGFMTKSHPG